MNPQDLEGFSYLDKDGHRITVLGPIGPEDTRVEVEREDGKRWGCPVAHLTDLYEQHAVDCYHELLVACEMLLNILPVSDVNPESDAARTIEQANAAIAKARCR